MKTEAPTTEELTARLEKLKSRYTEIYGVDLDGNEVVPEGATTQAKTTRAYQAAQKAYEASLVS